MTGSAIAVHSDCGGRILPRYAGAKAYDCASCGEAVGWPDPEAGPHLDALGNQVNRGKQPMSVPTGDDVKAMLYAGLVRNYAEATITEAVWKEAERKATATIKALGERGARQAAVLVIQSNTYGRKLLSASEAAEQVLARIEAEPRVD